MFTGLTEDLGTIRTLERRGEGGRLTVATLLPVEEIADGDSVAVNGLCLTVVARGASSLSFDLSPESLSRSNLGRKKPGTPVNLERALRLSDRLGGHLVSGHIDCTASVAGRREISGNLQLSFSMPGEHLRYLVDKGSVAIDGVSLTVNTVSPAGFTVNVIPHTASKTTLARLAAGDEVNIETDLLAKYVERLLGRGDGGGLTLDVLAKNGFV